MIRNDFTSSFRKAHKKRKIHGKARLSDSPEDLPPSVEISTSLLDAPVICVNHFSEDSAREFADAVSFLEQEKNVDKILVKVDSYGGDMYAVLSMIETIENCSKPIYTTCSGKAMSAGALLLSAGKKRFIGKYSTIMVHEVQGGTFGSTSQVQVDTVEQARLQSLYLAILAKNCNKKIDQVKSLIASCNGADVYLTPKQAKEFGIVDKIGLPKVNKKTTWHFSLEAEEG